MNFKFNTGISKQTVLFFIKLLILLSIFKACFFLVNADVLQINEKHRLMLIGWSLFYDLFTLLLVNSIFFLLLLLGRIVRTKYWISGVNVLFVLVNAVCLLLNLIDVFYFRFHGQRADADLVFVLADPISKIQLHWGWMLIALIALFIIILLTFQIHRHFIAAYSNSTLAGRSLLFIIPIVLLSFVSPRKWIPAYPLTQLLSSELNIVQNSLHTFIYSVFRSEYATVRPFLFMDNKKMDSLITIQHLVTPIAKKNIVLFIMESIPEDFFSKYNKYRVKMPFMDSIVSRSTYFSNAYCYSHNSNKSIVSVLAGLPTLTDIPLYHSRYADLSKTAIGDLIQQNNYSSSFVIGDQYDDFGFAKCTNWTGIKNYYCKDDIYKKGMQFHSMGLQDEYVLDFLYNKICASKQPFFTVQYNISTHFPNDIPLNYIEPFPLNNFNPPMRSMSYYSNCIQQFFNKAATTSWFKNTVFIFCSDHWMYTDHSDLSYPLLQRFKIPIFIYNPVDTLGKVINEPVSQLDILSTIVSFAGINQSILTYGESLLHPRRNRIVCMKENSTLYQAVDSSYVLGFNPMMNRVEYIYNYKKDPTLKHLIVQNKRTNEMLLYLQAFLQKASLHYYKKMPN